MISNELLNCGVGKSGSERNIGFGNVGSKDDLSRLVNIFLLMWTSFILFLFSHNHNMWY